MCCDKISLHSVHSRSPNLYGHVTSHTKTRLDMGTHAWVCEARPKYWLLVVFVSGQYFCLRSVKYKVYE